jgi:peptidoglycan hydrolase CwlO-like protein
MADFDAQIRESQTQVAEAQSKISELTSRIETARQRMETGTDIPSISKMRRWKMCMPTRN